MALDSEKLLSKLEQFDGYKDLTPEGKQMLHSICEGEPARTVGTNSLMTVHGELYSEDVDSTVQFESIAERTYVLDSLNDDETIGVLCQPAQVQVRAHDVRGRLAHRSITPDYIEFKAHLFSFIEVKTLEEIVKLSERYPKDWVLEAGKWAYLPGRAAAKLLGFGFRVHVHNGANKIGQANALMRLRVRMAKPEPLSQSKRRRILKLLYARPRSVLEICMRVGGVTASQLLLEVESNRFHGMLDIQIFEDAFLLFATGLEVERHLQELKRHEIVEAPSGPMHARYLRASPAELEHALRSQARFVERQALEANKTSNFYTIVRRIRLAKAENAPLLAAFVPDFAGRGGPGRPGSQAVKDAFSLFLKVDYLPNARGRTSPGRAVALFEKSYPQHQDQLSDETLRRLYHRLLAPEAVAIATRGRRGFHSERPRTDGSQVNVRAQICGLNAHLDGVRVDVRTNKESGGVVLIYFPMIDDQKQYVLSRGVSINRPHQLGVNLAIRDCVERHGFLPATILRDAGSENNNLTEPEKVALLGVVFQHRPMSSARHGGMDEGFHAKFNEFAATLDGSLHHDAAGRSSDGSKKSKRHARFTVDELVRKLDHWCFEVWNKVPTGTDGESREQVFQDHMQRYRDLLVPHTVSPLVAYATGYPIRMIKPDRRRGIRTHGKAFSSQTLSELLRLGVRPKEARLDCVDPSVLWVDNGTEFVPAYSFDHARLQSMGIAERLLYIEGMLSYAKDVKRVAKERRRAETSPSPDRDVAVPAPASAVPNYTQVPDVTLTTMLGPVIPTPIRRLGGQS